MASNHFPAADTPIFSTRGFAEQCDLSVSAASHRLLRLEKSGIVAKLTRGVWYQLQLKNLSRYSAIPILLNKEHGYLSFLSALNYHEAIEQIPTTVMIASTGYPRTLSTPLGVYEFFKLKPQMMTDGYSWSRAPQPYLVASPEKALLDTFYLATRKGKRFSSLPEIDWSRLKRRELEELAMKHISYPSIRNAVMKRVEELSAVSELR